jgi:hypothetical protein
MSKQQQRRALTLHMDRYLSSDRDHRLSVQACVLKEWKTTLPQMIQQQVLGSGDVTWNLAQKLRTLRLDEDTAHTRKKFVTTTEFINPMSTKKNPDPELMLIMTSRLDTDREGVVYKAVVSSTGECELSLRVEAGTAQELVAKFYSYGGNYLSADDVVEYLELGDFSVLGDMETAVSLTLCAS